MIDEAGKSNAPFREILVWKFSRFTRKREHAVAFKSMLRRKGVRVVSITEHADDTPTGKLMEAIIESVDEFYSENLAEEVKRGMRGGRLPGLLDGQPHPLRLQPRHGARRRQEAAHPGTGPRRRPGGAAHLRPGRGRHRDAQDHPAPSTTRASPAPPASSGPRTASTSSSETMSIRGTLVWGARGKDKDKVEPVRIEKAFPAIVSKAQFRRVNRLMHSRAPKRTHPPPGGQHLPAQRAGQVPPVQAGALRPGRQERPVRLLRLPVPDQAGQRRLRFPQAQRAALRGTGGGEDSLQHPHREQHRQPGQGGGRGDGRDCRRAA